MGNNRRSWSWSKGGRRETMGQAVKIKYKSMAFTTKLSYGVIYRLV